MPRAGGWIGYSLAHFETLFGVSGHWCVISLTTSAGYGWILGGVSMLSFFSAWASMTQHHDGIHEGICAQVIRRAAEWERQIETLDQKDLISMRYRGCTLRHAVSSLTMLFMALFVLRYDNDIMCRCPQSHLSALPSELLFELCGSLWQRCCGSEEMELHQTQLKLIREQTATFIRDLNSLQQEVRPSMIMSRFTCDLIF
jgi:hypothetical protein